MDFGDFAVVFCDFWGGDVSGAGGVPSSASGAGGVSSLASAFWFSWSVDASGFGLTDSSWSSFTGIRVTLFAG